MISQTRLHNRTCALKPRVKRHKWVCRRENTVLLLRPLSGYRLTFSLRVNIRLHTRRNPTASVQSGPWIYIYPHFQRALMYSIRRRCTNSETWQQQTALMERQAKIQKFRESRCGVTELLSETFCKSLEHNYVTEPYTYSHHHYCEARVYTHRLFH